MENTSIENIKVMRLAETGKAMINVIQLSGV